MFRGNKCHADYRNTPAGKMDPRAYVYDNSNTNRLLSERRARQ